mgnify:CR=1 FL=1
MTFRKMLPLMLLATLLVVPAAEAKYRVGVGDQNAAMFDSSRWQSLKLKRTRYLVPWDWNKSAGQIAETTGFMNRARAASIRLPFELIKQHEIVQNLVVDSVSSNVRKGSFAVAIGQRRNESR